MSERAIILANRSATLFHMEKYDETLIDVQRSIDLGYPKDLIYKLYERQARCYMVKKAYNSTIASFKWDAYTHLKNYLCKISIFHL